MITDIRCVIACGPTKFNSCCQVALEQMCSFIRAISLIDLGPPMPFTVARSTVMSFIPFIHPSLMTNQGHSLLGI